MNGRLLILLLAVLAGCSASPVTLVHPRSGKTVSCAPGPGGSVFLQQARIRACANEQEALGFVRLENLTPEQRADYSAKAGVGTPESAGTGK